MSWPSNSARTKNWGTEILTDADQEAQLDLLHAYNNDQLNSSTGHAHTGGTNDGPKITLTAAAGVQGTLPIANGGTGVTTLAALGSLFMPVGTIYMNDEVSTNPGTLLGFGTWTAIADRMILGVGSTFATAKATGGATTYDLSHDHGGFTGGVNFSGGDGSDTAGALDTKHRHSIASGGSATQSVMNPYYCAYVWRRAS